VEKKGRGVKKKSGVTKFATVHGGRLQELGGRGDLFVVQRGFLQGKKILLSGGFSLRYERGGGGGGMVPDLYP